MGKRIGHYQLEEKIGSGNYGVVYLGHDTRTGEKIAAKSISINTLNKKLREQLECEIKVLKSIHSPYIIRLNDVLRTNNNVYMFMEYCAGGDLDKYVKAQKSVEESLAQKWLRQLVEAFITLQENQIMHRDLKLANILLTAPDGDIKIADFGFAKFLSENSLAVTQLGTPLFMAPEIFNAENYSYKADVWSMGVLSYEILVGKPAFACQTVVKLRQLQASPIAFPSTSALSEQAKDFVLSMLTYDHNARPSFYALKEHPFLRPITIEQPIIDEESSEEDYILLEESQEEIQVEELEMPKAEEAKIDEVQDIEDTYERTDPELPKEEPPEDSRKHCRIAIELDFKVSQVEKILSVHRELVERENREGALAIVYYCKKMFKKFFEMVNDMSRDFNLTRSSDLMFAELYEKIQLNLLSVTELFEQFAVEFLVDDNQDLSEVQLSRFAFALLIYCEERLTSQQSDFKVNLELLAIVSDLQPSSDRAKELYTYCCHQFQQMKIVNNT